MVYETLQIYMNIFWDLALPRPLASLCWPALFVLYMPPVAKKPRRRAYPALPSPESAGVGSIPANPDAQNVPSFKFRRWRFEMKLSPFYISQSGLITAISIWGQPYASGDATGFKLVGKALYRL